MKIVPEVDFFQPETLASPFEFYEQAFHCHPMVKVSGHDVYCVFTDKLVKEVIDRIEDFSSDFGPFTMGARANDPEINAIIEAGWPFVKTLVISDPPEHTRYRKLVNKAFSKPRIDRLEASIRTIAERLLNQATQKARFDFVAEFAVPFPVEVICDLLGLRELGVETVKRWSDAILEQSGGRGLIDRERELHIAREILAFQRSMMDICNARRAHGKADLITDLVNARVEGERPLDDAELLSILKQIMAAGNETTTIALTRGLLLLIKNPDQQSLARQDYGRIPAMVEEIVRIESPPQSVWRVVAHDTVLDGAVIPKGAMVMARTGAANRDPAVHSNPGKFDIQRENAANHVAFGRGAHTCLGNMLARKELTVAFETIFETMDEIQVAEGSDLTYVADLVHPYLARLPITFSRKRERQAISRRPGL
jgi:cytochrome P450